MAAKILFVDDDEENLLVCVAHCGQEFDVITARGAAEALELLEREDVGVVVADQRMPRVTGVELFEQIAERYPDVVRILLTAYSDISAAIGAINRGQVRRYLKKPWQAEELKAELRDASELYEMSRKMRALTLRLRETERVYALGIITASVGHELRNPVSWIQGNLELIRTQVDGLEVTLSDRGLGDAVAPRLSKIRRSLVDALDGVSRVLDIVRGIGIPESPVSSRVVPLAEILRLSLRMINSELNDTARVECDVRGDPMVQGGMTRVGQIVLNLVVNAFQALRERPVDANRVRISVSANSDWAQLEVSDNGPGIPEAVRERVFDPFYTSNPEGGTGLGLAICRRIAQELGGTLNVDADPVLGGARFTLKLPLAG